MKTCGVPIKLVSLHTVIILALFACSNGVSNAKRLPLKAADGQIDLAKVLPGEWGRVCVIGPYSTNKHAREILGIPVNIVSKSDIYMSDSIALLVAMQGEGVSGLFEVPRGSVDFASLGGKCYRRGDSGFTVPDEGHPHATHA